MEAIQYGSFDNIRIEVETALFDSVYGKLSKEIVSDMSYFEMPTEIQYVA